MNDKREIVLAEDIEGVGKAGDVVCLMELSRWAVALGQKLGRVAQVQQESCCTCDVCCDDPCPVHRSENVLQNRVLEAESSLKEVKRACDRAEKRFMHEYLDRNLAEDALRKAWDLYQESGVMHEPDGSTGNLVLDLLGSHLDEWSSRPK